MRADARRNRERLLAAADEVFAESGTDTSTEEVARRAGVGIGTVFRHFPTKEALLEAVFVRRLRQLADHADGLADAPDPGQAFFAFLDALAELTGTKRALSDALADAGVDVMETAAPVKGDVRRAGATLLRRAQDAGAVRPEVGVDELMALLVGVARTAEQTAHDPVLRAKVTGLLTAGLRAPDQRSAAIKGTS